MERNLKECSLLPAMNGNFIAACTDGQVTSCLSLLCKGLNLAATKPKGVLAPPSLYAVHKKGRCGHVRFHIMNFTTPEALDAKSTACWQSYTGCPLEVEDRLSPNSAEAGVVIPPDLMLDAATVGQLHNGAASTAGCWPCNHICTMDAAPSHCSAEHSREAMEVCRPSTAWEAPSMPFPR
jgi:hypothetical protein